MSKGRVERRLAAILAADMAGYSRLMEEDEEGTLRRLQAHRRELIDPKMREHRGRIVKTTGDGMLVEFSSVVDAVRCAVEVQRGMLEREAQASAKERIEFRVGINLGDIILDKGDIFGDGVNVAARLEALAEPGGLCVSGTVRDHIGDRVPYVFADMGEQSVKNIARPVRAYAMTPAAVAETPLVAVKPPPRFATGRRLAIAVASLAALFVVGAVGWLGWPRLHAPTAATSAAKPAPLMSVVVLPFANLSNDPDEEHFADAVTDDLTTDLSRIKGSLVISRLAASTYKGKPVDAKQLGHDLGVRYVLEGSVRPLGEQVQVNVQLIDDSGADVWTDRFETDRRDLAKAQSEITDRLAQTLQLALIEAVGRKVDQEANPDAQDLIMRGWASEYRPQNEAELSQMQKSFERALELDPDSAEARAGVATALIYKVTTGWTKSRAQDMERADRLLTEALARDRTLPRLHWALGMLRLRQSRLAEAKIEFENALALDHNYAGAMLQLGFTLIGLGQPEAALPYFEKSIKLMPRYQNIHQYYYGLGYCHLLLNHLDEAIEFLEKAHSANPHLWWIPMTLAAAYGLKGNIDEAKTALAEYLKLDPKIHSLVDFRRLHPPPSPAAAAISDRTLIVGLRRAGLPDE